MDTAPEPARPPSLHSALRRSRLPLVVALGFAAAAIAATVAVPITLLHRLRHPPIPSNAANDARTHEPLKLHLLKPHMRPAQRRPLRDPGAIRDDDRQEDVRRQHEDVGVP
jgi:hypothetical protein